MKILVTGTPGVGKTTLSSYLSSILQIPHIDVSSLIIKNKLYDMYSEEDDTFDFSARKVRKHLKNVLLDDFIVETHTIEIIKKYKFDHVFIIRAPVSILTKRLSERGYKAEKIEANIDCEIFNEIGFLAEKYFDNVKYFGSEEIEVNIIEDVMKFLGLEKMK